MEPYEAVCRHFALLSGVGTMTVSPDGDALYRTPLSCGVCDFCDLINITGESRERCRTTPHYGSHQARRFNGRYVFFCHRGLAHFTSPVSARGVLRCALYAGPFLMVAREDYFISDLAVFKRREPAIPSFRTLREPLSRIPVLTPEKVHALSEILFCCAGHLSRSEEEPGFDFLSNQNLPGVITEYIERIRVKGETGFYPLQKEEELLAAMSQGDVTAARLLLNELLGYIFFYSGMRFDVIRSRVLELIVLLSRAAVKGGADAERIFGLNFDYLREISRFDNIEDLSAWLSEVMNRFTDYVFRFTDVKHADIIYKAIDLMKAGFMKKLTLEETARSVFLSPSYFSRVFKEETGYAFTEYLNKVRIEESRKLLRNEHVNLADVAGMVGYEDQSYFSKVFKKITGMTPLKYRQSRGPV